MGLSIIVNGQEKLLANLSSPTTLAEVIRELALKVDRIAVEHNGNIAQRTTWESATIASGDRLEIVHFVGGGSNSAYRLFRTRATVHNICYRTLGISEIAQNSELA